MNYKNKNVVLIMPYFFDYHNEIFNELDNNFNNVLLFNERPDNSIKTKILLKLRKNILAKKIDDYYHSILKKLNNYSIDYVLIIKGETTPKWFLQQLKKNNPSIKTILYLWDSIEYIPNYFVIKNEIDYLYSFDINDVKTYGLRHIPNFRSPKFDQNINFNIKYDMCYVGTINFDRAYIINEILDQYKNLNFALHLYFHSKWIYLLKFIFNKEIRRIPRKYIKFSPLDQNEILKLYKSSKIIIDIQAPNQGGLSMRPFETMKLNRKLITTNEKIKLYSFYNNKNIEVIDRECVNINPNFITAEYEPINEEILNKYSLKNWINKIFEEDYNENYWY
ncbi:hypothetical protein [Macrococcus animalis]|uniref:hypothetical protein n=1 Tax=Macrococcus animalis TaxID=3395467 RepID=UPI0039BE1F70